MALTTVETTRLNDLPFEALALKRSQGRRKVGVSSPDPIALIAHDIRGPLANLSLILESIDASANDRATSRTGSQVARAMQVIERLDSMLSGFIERARHAGDPLAIELWPVSIPDLVEQIATLNQPLARQHGVRLHVYSAEPLSVAGDGHLLMQALDNLIINAVKHSPRGGLVTVEAMPEDGWVVVRVEDQGPGFTDDDIARAFQPYTRLSAIAASSLPSTGLGLSIVRQIAERHSGSVSAAHSPSGRGAAVTLRLPQSH